ncbi:uncharacterized protein TRAVEDRAFT_78532, partial [Trametes versicolor FP-101664 SS1]|uniref:uncharacterized protein n=1 Tax=Trametes versicolor (strain FP-101664) TaxID=717944 RepID=UPI000462134C
RQQVRLRDGHCRLSGVMGVLRDRGFDFTGIEVAHIWALAHAHPEVRWDDVSDATIEEAKTLLSSKENADVRGNAFLLRTDIHRCFDRYLVGIY